MTERIEEGLLPAGDEVLCQYCGCPITDRAVACRACATLHHEECFVENGACTVYACACTSYVVEKTGQGVELAPTPATRRKAERRAALVAEARAAEGALVPRPRPGFALHVGRDRLRIEIGSQLRPPPPTRRDPRELSPLTSFAILAPALGIIFQFLDLYNLEGIWNPMHLLVGAIIAAFVVLGSVLRRRLGENGNAWGGQTLYLTPSELVVEEPEAEGTAKGKAKGKAKRRPKPKRTRVGLSRVRSVDLSTKATGRSLFGFERVPALRILHDGGELHVGEGLHLDELRWLLGKLREGTEREAP